MVDKKKKDKTKRGQPDFLAAIKKDGAKTVIIEGYTYVYGDNETLIPQYGRIASKGELSLIAKDKNPYSAWVKAVKLLNGVN